MQMATTRSMRATRGLETPIKPPVGRNEFEYGPDAPDAPAEVLGNEVTSVEIAVTETSRNTSRYDRVVGGEYADRLPLKVTAHVRTGQAGLRSQFTLRFVDNFGSNRVATGGKQAVPEYVAAAVEAAGYNFIGVRSPYVDRNVETARVLSHAEAGDELRVGHQRWNTDDARTNGRSVDTLTVTGVETPTDEQTIVTAEGTIRGTDSTVVINAGADSADLRRTDDGQERVGVVDYVAVNPEVAADA